MVGKIEAARLTIFAEVPGSRPAAPHILVSSASRVMMAASRTFVSVGRNAVRVGTAVAGRIYIQHRHTVLLRV